MFYILRKIYKQIVSHSKVRNSLLFYFAFDYIIKPLSYVFSEMRQYNEHEEQILTESKFGRFLFKSLTVRILRVLSLLAILNMFYITIILDILIYKLGSDHVVAVLLLDKKVMYVSIFLGILGFLFTALFYTFNLFLRIVKIKKLIKNSPVTVTKCVIFAVKTCAVGSALAMTGFSIPAIDSTMKEAGLVPPLKSFYADAPKAMTGGYVTLHMGSNPSANLHVLKGDEFPGSSFIRDLQLKTLESEQKLHSEFEQQKKVVSK